MHIFFKFSGSQPTHMRAPTYWVQSVGLGRPKSISTFLREQNQSRHFRVMRAQMKRLGIFGGQPFPSSPNLFLLDMDWSHSPQASRWHYRTSLNLESMGKENRPTEPMYPKCVVLIFSSTSNRLSEICNGVFSTPEFGSWVGRRGRGWAHSVARSCMVSYLRNVYYVIKFGDSRSNVLRDIRGTDFVSNERTNEHWRLEHLNA